MNDNLINEQISSDKLERVIERNVQAEQEFLVTYPQFNSIEEAMRKTGQYGEMISYLRLLGLRCTSCGNHITQATLAFFGYNVKKVKCYECQNTKTF